MLIVLQNDCIQWIMETSPKQNPWSAERVVFEMLALWFGSVYGMSMVRAFLYPWPF